MSLDSLALLMTFEKKFQKEVPDLEAEKINTIGDMTNWFYQNLVIYSPEKPIKQNLLKAINLTFNDLKLISQSLSLKDYLDTIIPKTKRQQTWQELANLLNLTLPNLNKNDFIDEMPKELKFLGITLQKPKKPFLNNDLNRIIDCIAALNYQELVDFERITGIYEIYIAIMGITHEYIGADIDEIYWESSFANDLGID